MTTSFTSARRAAPWLALLTLAACLLGGGAPAAAADGMGFLDLVGVDLKIQGGIIEYRQIEEERVAVIRSDARNLAMIRIAIGERTITLRARNLLVYLGEPKRAYAEGEVFVEESNGSSFACDAIYFQDLSDPWGMAENVRFRYRKQAAKPPSAVYYDVTTSMPGGGGGDVLSLGQPQGGYNELSRMNVLADSLRVISRETIEAENATVTPSNFAKPHVAITANKARLRPNEKVEIWGGTLRIKGVPVLYVPYVIKDLRYNWPWVRVAGGHEENWGFYGLTRWGLDLDPPAKRYFRPEKIFFDLDYRQNRGYAGGAEASYRMGHKGSWGKILGYSVPREPMMKHSEDYERALEDTQYPIEVWGARDLDGNLLHPGYEDPLYRDEYRGMAEWWHFHKFTDDLDLRMQAHFYSDRDFEEEYFPNKARTDREKLNNASFRWIQDNFKMELVAQGRTNKFRSQTEYFPEYRFNLPGLRLGELPLFLSNETRFGVMKRRDDEILDDLELIRPDRDRVRIDGTTPDIVRAHHETLLKAPFDVGPIKVEPYIGGRNTFYSKTFDPTYYKNDYDYVSNPGVYLDSATDPDAFKNHDDADINSALLYGGEISTRMQGYYGARTWRHIVEPRLSFFGRSRPTLDAKYIYDMDQVDTYRGSRLLLFELDNRLQRNTNGSVRDYLTFNVKLGYEFSKDAAERIYGGYYRDRQMTFLNLQTAWRPTDNLTISGSGNYDVYDQEFDSAQVGFYWTWSPRLSLYLSNSWVRGRRWVETISGNEYYRKTNASFVTNASIKTQLWDENSNYSMAYSISYQHLGDDFGVLDSETGLLIGRRREGIREQKVSLYRDFPSFTAGVHAAYAYNDDWSVTFNLTPKGWVGIQRHAAGYTDAELSEASRYGRPRTAIERDEDARGATNVAAPIRADATAASEEMYDSVLMPVE